MKYRDSEDLICYVESQSCLWASQVYIVFVIFKYQDILTVLSTFIRFTARATPTARESLQFTVHLPKGWESVLQKYVSQSAPLPQHFWGMWVERQGEGKKGQAGEMTAISSPHELQHKLPGTHNKI